MEKARRLAIALTAASLAVALVAGCGSDSTTRRVDTTRTGTLTTASRLNVDGSRADVVQFRATRDGYVRVTMERHGTRPVDDPYIVVWYGRADDFDDFTFIGSDDDSGGCWDAMLVFPVTRNAWYSVMLTTYGPADLGTYRYTIRELLCGVAAAQVTAPPADPDKTPADVGGKRTQ